MVAKEELGRAKTMVVAGVRSYTFLRIVVGVALGLLVCVIPVVPFVFPFLSVTLLVALVIRLRMFGWRRDAMTVLTGCIVLTVCAYLPVKQLDVEVGPIAYDSLSLSELCDRLGADYGITCHVWDRSAYTCRLSFSTNRPLSRRKVLEQLSNDTDRPLHIGYCGTNATILFGAYPSFTYLGEEQPGR